MSDFFIDVDLSQYPISSYSWGDWINWYFNIKD